MKYTIPINVIVIPSATRKFIRRVVSGGILNTIISIVTIVPTIDCKYPNGFKTGFKLTVDSPRSFDDTSPCITGWYPRVLPLVYQI